VHTQPGAHEYEKTVVCPFCGSPNVMNTEAQRQRELAARSDKLCRCGAYPFPHDPGSFRACEQHPDADKPMTEVERMKYAQVIGQPT